MKIKNESVKSASDSHLVNDSQELETLVRGLVGEKRLHACRIRQRVAEGVDAELKKVGHFHHTTLGNFFAANGSLIAVEGAEFARVLKDLTGLMPDESEFRDLRRRLKSSIDAQHLIPMHKLSYYNAERGVLAVSDGGSGMLIREVGGEWSYRSNGDDDIFFLPDAIEPWQPQFNSNGSHLRWFLEQFRFLNARRLTAWDQQNLLLHYLMHRFFPPLCGSNIIPAFLGIPGTLKSTALRLLGGLLIGSRFSVTDMSTLRRDFFEFGIYAGTVSAIDNVDPKVKWLLDGLSNYATTSGSGELAMLIISSRDLNFTRTDVLERFLPLYCGRPSKFKSQTQILAELACRRDGILGDLLTSLGTVMDRLAATRAEPVPLRMPDFGSFMERTAEDNGRSEAEDSVSPCLRRLQLAQADSSLANDDMASVIQTLLERVSQVPRTPIGEFSNQCNEIAAEQHLSIPGSVQGFGQRLTKIIPMLETVLSIRVIDTKPHARKRFIEILPNHEVGGAQISADEDETVTAPDESVSQGDGGGEYTDIEQGEDHVTDVGDRDAEVEQPYPEEDGAGRHNLQGEADDEGGSDPKADRRYRGK